MKPNRSVFDTIFNALRERRWVMVVAFTLLLFGLELVRLGLGTQYHFDQAYRVLLFGVALPLLVGITVSVPSEIEKTLSLASRTKDRVKRRVLVATKEMLLGAGIKSLLMNQKELVLIGLIPGNNIDLINRINQLKPEVVILDEKMYLSSANEMLACMNERPEMRLVIVSDSENRVQIYHKRQLSVTQSMDLVEMMCRT